MTLDEAYAEMKRRGWGFARNRATGRFAVGPMDAGGWITVLAFGDTGVSAVEAAIRADAKKRKTGQLAFMDDYKIE